MSTHEPLDRHKSEIRLVRLAPGDDGDAAPLSLELRHDSLDNEDIGFVALSYVWGSTENPSVFNINGTLFPINRNLHVALKALSKIESVASSWLWIDAICINQSDPLEKTWQVSKMGEIYRRATLVCSWLGLGSEYTNQALSFIERLGSRAVAAGLLKLTDMSDDMVSYLAARPAGEALDGSKTYEGDSELSRFMYDFLNERGLYGSVRPEEDLCSGIQELAKNEYWSRVWIVQEITRAKTGLLVCGDQSAFLDSFHAIWLATALCVFVYCPGNPAYSRFMYNGNDLHIHWWFMLPVMTRHRLNIGSSVRLDEILHHGCFSGNENFYLATDPRDIVFALLGVVSDSEKLGLEVDYARSTIEVFTSLRRALINRADEVPRAFHLDDTVPRMAPVDGLDALPSWVPDWREMGKVGKRVENINTWEFFDASKGKKAARTDAKGSGILSRAGCQVDVIAEVMQPPPQLDFDIEFEGDLPILVAAILEFTGILPNAEAGPGEDHVWRTIISQSVLYKETLQRLEDPEEVRSLIRSVMRQQPLDPEKFGPKMIEFMQFNVRFRPDFDFYPETVGPLSHRIQEWADGWASHNLRSVTRQRRLFKTATGLLGLGHKAIEPGDQVTLQWGVKSPIVLRRVRGSGAEERFLFVGDAYVDGIMFGEFLDTGPEERVFDIV